MCKWGWMGAGLSKYGWVQVVGHFLCVSGGGWRYILGVWWWVDIFYGWMGVEVYFVWVGVGGGIFCVDGGGWTFFMGRWEWVEVYFG